MAQQGGNRPVRTNTQAKPVSGPGKLSQRTDMIPSGGAYGERKAIEENIAAGNRATPDPAPRRNPLAGLFEPTMSPNEAVTAGNPMGLGPGPEIMNLPARTFNPTEILTRLAQSDPSGEVDMVLRELNDKGIF
jgi:hypothetical protein